MSRSKKERNPWERRPDESSRAYRAFCVYRNLDPSKRSLTNAYSHHRGIESASAGGTWRGWSVQYEWVARCEAWDAHLDEAAQEAAIDRRRELERKRVDFEFEDFDVRVSRTRKIDKLLDKADAAPVTDVEREEDIITADNKIIKRRTKVKAVNMSGYARLVGQRDVTAKGAIVGVRGEDESKKQTDATVRKIEWKKPSVPKS